METGKQPSFSEIGLGYAERFGELEEARSKFNEERRKMLAALAAIVNEGLKEKGIKFKEEFTKKPRTEEPGEEVDAWYWNIERAYSKAWNEGKGKNERKEYLSYIEMWLSYDVEMPFGFHTFLRFKDEKHEIAKEDEDINNEELARRGIAGPASLWGSSSIYLWITSICPEKGGKFNFESFAAEARKLPELFIKADEYFAGLVEKARKEKEEE